MKRSTERSADPPQDRRRTRAPALSAVSERDEEAAAFVDDASRHLHPNSLPRTNRIPCQRHRFSGSHAGREPPHPEMAASPRHGGRGQRSARRGGREGPAGGGADGVAAAHRAAASPAAAAG